MLPTLLKLDGNKKIFSEAYNEFLPDWPLPENSDYKDDYLIDFNGGKYSFIESVLAVSHSGEIITKWNIYRGNPYCTQVYQYHNFPMYFTSYE